MPEKMGIQRQPMTTLNTRHIRNVKLAPRHEKEQKAAICGMEYLFQERWGGGEPKSKAAFMSKEFETQTGEQALLKGESCRGQRGEAQGANGGRESV